MNKGITRLAETHCKATQSVSVLCTADGRVFLACYKACEKDLYPFYPVHRHEELEVLLVTDGAAIVRRDGEQYTVHTGDVCVFTPFSTHAIECLNGQSVAFESFVFNFRLAGGNGYFVGVDRFAEFFNGSGVPCVIHPDSDIDGRLSASVSAVCNARAVDHNVAETMTEVLVLLRRHACPSSNDIAEQKRLHAARQALDYIGAHHTDKFTVDDLAQACGYSQFYLMKLFKQYVGMTVVDYTNCLRLYHAEKLLHMSRPVAETARKVGYDNISYFNRQFKRLYGVTPTEYCKVRL